MSIPRWRPSSLHAESLAARGGNLAPWRDSGDLGPLFHTRPTQPTELAAAKRATHSSPKLRDLVLSWIREAGAAGLTSKEARARFLAERGRDDGYSLPPRFAELRTRGLIELAGCVRDGALVYRAVP